MTPTTRHRLLVACPLLLLTLLAAPAAHATTGGSSMPWDTGLANLADNITGPTARALIIIASSIFRFARFVVGCVFCVLGLIGGGFARLGLIVSHPDDRRFLPAIPPPGFASSLRSPTSSHSRSRRRPTQPGPSPN